MKRFYYNIVQRLSDGSFDDQNVWVTASCEQEAENQIVAEYWGVCEMTLTHVCEA